MPTTPLRISPALGQAERLSELDLGNNLVTDIAVLASELPALRLLYVHGNRLNEKSVREHVPAMRDLGVEVYNAALSISDISVKEGEAFLMARTAFRVDL